MLALSAALAPSAAPAQTPVRANALIPKPPPTAPLTDWVNAKGRTTVTLTAPGAILRGWSYAGADPKSPAIVFFGGDRLPIDREDATLRALAALGPTVVAYDYRGFGFSLGVADVASMQQDAVRIVEATQRTATHGVVAYGFSFGTAIAAYAASTVPVTGVVLAAPFATAQEALGASMSPSPDAVAAFGNGDFVGRIGAPLLILHGSADTDVPIAQGREVFAASTSQYKDFIELPDVTHDQTVDAPAAHAAVKTFLAARNR